MEQNAKQQLAEWNSKNIGVFREGGGDDYEWRVISSESHAENLNEFSLQ